MDLGAMLLPSGLDRRVDSPLTLGLTVSVHFMGWNMNRKHAWNGNSVIDRIVGGLEKD